jgi:hypothetical protein
MNPQPRAEATHAPKMKPRASIAAILVIPALRHGTQRPSTAFAIAPADWSSGVMSLNMMPGFGKSGMSRM